LFPLRKCVTKNGNQNYTEICHLPLCFNPESVLSFLIFNFLSAERHPPLNSNQQPEISFPKKCNISVAF
jgi:hypothetical protein